MSGIKKNYYALKLAGLWNEQAGPPMGAGPDAAGADQGGGGEQGGDDPGSLIDQAIELLNKAKEALGGGGSAGGEGDQGGGMAPPPNMGM